MSKSTKALMALALLIPVLSSCKSRRVIGSKAQANITEAGESVRVIYLDDKSGHVYLVTCAKENGKVEDHVLDEQVISRATCNADASTVGATNAMQFTTMRYQEEYLPALTKAIGFSADSATTAAEVDALKRNIEKQQAALDKLVRLVISADGVNKESIDSQVITVTQQLEALKSSLDPNGESKITLLEKLKSYLLITSQDRFNVAEESAGLLLAPFAGREQAAKQKVDEAERARSVQEQAKIDAQRQVEDANRERLQVMESDRQAVKSALNLILYYETTGRSLRARDAQERANYNANLRARNTAAANQNVKNINYLVEQITQNLNAYNAEIARCNRLAQAFRQKYGQNP